ncbi:MAG: Ulp1 family isopeptidase, partial [Gammaproteobacteria bacterium]
LCAIIHDLKNDRYIAYFLPCSDGREKTPIRGEKKLTDSLDALSTKCTASSICAENATDSAKAQANEKLMDIFNSKLDELIIPLSQNESHWITLDVKKENINLYDSRSKLVTTAQSLLQQNEKELIQHIIDHHQGTLARLVNKDKIATIEPQITPITLGTQPLTNDSDCGPFQRRVQSNLIRGEEINKNKLSKFDRLFHELTFSQALMDPRLSNIRASYFDDSTKPIPDKIENINRYYRQLATLINDYSKGNGYGTILISNNNLPLSQVKEKVEQLANHVQKNMPDTATNFKIGIDRSVRAIKDVIAATERITPPNVGQKTELKKSIENNNDDFDMDSGSSKGRKF